jgi:hypothetical protein
MYRLIIALTFGILLEAYPQKFAGQVYQIAESYLETECVVNPECDCCASDIVFLTEKKFGLISRCIYNDAYYTGTYQVKDDKLVLTFKQAVVTEIVDEGTKKVENERRNIIIEPINYKISNCGLNSIRLEFTDKDGKDFQNGSRRTQADEKRIMKKLGETTAWKLISE